MARYIMANRRAGMFDDGNKLRSREALHRSFDAQLASHVDLVSESKPLRETDRRIVVFDADPGEVESRRATFPSEVLVEPEIIHVRATIARPLDLVGRSDAEVSARVLSGSGRTTHVTIRGNGSPLEGAELMLFLRGSFGLETDLKAVTPASGAATFTYSAFWTPAALIVVPAGGFWSIVVRGDPSGLVVDVPALPDTAPHEWWHRLMRADRAQPSGEGVRVGVLDTGLGPHPDLVHAKSVGSFVNGLHDPAPAAGLDVDSHGTHVCGTVGARPASGGFEGLAPAVELFSGRVFPSAESGANQGDIAAGIDFLSKESQVDLINMSLGAPVGSQIERDAIVDALERGTVCVVAAGNSAGPVEFPARFPETIAVAAIGLAGWGPPGSLASIRLPDDPAKFGDDNLYLANFSCHGSEIDCCAPGVGILSTVPSRFGHGAPYASMDGTSMASPAACAIMARALSGSKEYMQLPRDLTRSQSARSLLKTACRDVGLDESFQGRGVPQVV